MAFNGGTVTGFVTSEIKDDPDFSRKFKGKLLGKKIKGKLVRRENEFKNTCGRSGLVTKHGDVEMSQRVTVFVHQGTVTIV